MNEEITITISEEETLNAQVQDINYIPGYKTAEEERRTYYNNFIARVSSGEFDGKDGIDGEDGASAYEIWLSLGNTGTEEEFIESLKGEQGNQGEQGIQGEQGEAGVGVPSGGITGQILAKSNDDDYETEWINQKSNAEELTYDNSTSGLTSVNVQSAIDEINKTIPTNISELNNDSGYLTTFDETDPIFSSSVASSITESNIQNWNNKLETTDLSGYATETYVSNAIANAQLEDSDVDLSGYATLDDLNNKQDLLVSGTNIKTINGESLLSAGDLTIKQTATDLEYDNSSSGLTSTNIQNAIDEVNNNIPTNYITSDNLSAVATSGSYNDLVNVPEVDTEMSDTSTNAVQNNIIKAYVDDLVGDIATVLSTLTTVTTEEEI